jgi:hypothetical protein
MKPRSVRLKHGLVILKGFPLEMLNDMEEHLLKFKPGQKIEVLPILEIKPEIKVFNDKAIGLKEISPSNFQLIVIGFDSSTKESIIEEVKHAGSFKEEAQSNYRQELFKRGLV